MGGGETVIILIILAIFIALKNQKLAQIVSAWLRRLAGQSAELASELDIAWLGFSYLAFRMLHVLRDYQAGRINAPSLRNLASYAFYFPAFTAGPIDRYPRFSADLERIFPTTSSKESTDAAIRRQQDLFEGGRRLAIGLFKKFVVADSLAIFSLSSQNANQVSTSGWLWLLVYAYSLRIYLDFSGYTDIALGLSRWMGIRLPENFDRPYLKTNLTAFWNSWHITLAQWFRAYIFNPLTRALRSREKPTPIWLIILAGQTLIMTLIGLWHGITWNFAIWGLWHAVGLFIHNRWSDWIRPRAATAKPHQVFDKTVKFAGWFLTFHYVTLGWVWFALPSTPTAWQVMLKLFNL